MCAVFSQQILFDFKIAGLLQSRDVRAKIAVCRADDTLQPLEFQLLSRRGGVFSVALTFKGTGCGFSFLPTSARTFGRAPLGFAGTTVAEIPRAVR